MINSNKPKRHTRVEKIFSIPCFYHHRSLYHPSLNNCMLIVPLSYCLGFRDVRDKNEIFQSAPDERDDIVSLLMVAMWQAVLN